MSTDVSNETTAVAAAAAPQEGAVRPERSERGERGSRRRDRDNRDGREGRSEEQGERRRERHDRGPRSDSAEAAPASTLNGHAPVAETPVAAAAPQPAPAPVAAPAAAPVAEIPREAAKAFTYALPTDAGLQMMETRSTGSLAQVVAEEPVKRGRARPPRAEVAAEPMQMVETGKPSVQPETAPQ